MQRGLATLWGRSACFDLDICTHRRNSGHFRASAFHGLTVTLQLMSELFNPLHCGPGCVTHMQNRQQAESMEGLNIMKESKTD